MFIKHFDTENDHPSQDCNVLSIANANNIEPEIESPLSQSTNNQNAATSQGSYVKSKAYKKAVSEIAWPAPLPKFSPKVQKELSSGKSFVYLMFSKLVISNLKEFNNYLINYISSILKR